MTGPSNTLLIEGSFSELAEELAHYIDTISKSEDGAGVQAEIGPILSTIRESEQSQENIDDAKVQKAKDEVLKRLVTSAAALKDSPEREFTAAYNLLISLSAQSSIRDQLFGRICQYLSGQPSTSSSPNGPALAIATLSTIFNVLPVTSNSRYHVFHAILTVINQSSSTQAFEALIPQLDANVPIWLSAWQLDEEDARHLHTAIADVAHATGYEELSYKYLLFALETISPAAASETESQELAKRTLLAALTNPSVTDFTSLTALDSVQALRKSDTNLFDLLEIFSSDDYSAYLDFLETNTLDSLSIPESASEILSTKIRLLTLATIAASSVNRSIPYSVIASALQIPSEDVEMWVIDTIRAGLVEGKLSQLKQELLVQRATYRVFGEKQWAEIQGRLMVWRRSLESVLSVVRSEKERYAREGPGTSDDQVQGQGRGMNGYANEGGQRRYGGRDRDRNRGQQQSQREVDHVGGD